MHICIAKVVYTRGLLELVCIQIISVLMIRIQIISPRISDCCICNFMGYHK